MSINNNNFIPSISSAASTYITGSNSGESVEQKEKKRKHGTEDNGVSDQNAVSIHSVPRELFLNHIFKFLSPKDLGRTSCVCKSWNRLAYEPSLWNAFDLKQVFPSLKILDASVWKAYMDFTNTGICFDDAQAQDSRSIIRSLTMFFDSIETENGSGATCLTIPKGLDLVKLIQITSANDEVNKAQSITWNLICDRFARIATSETRQVVITNSVLKGSRNLTDSQQKELLNKIGCEIPDLLTAVTFFFFQSIGSLESPSIHLPNNEEESSIRCSRVMGTNCILTKKFLNVMNQWFIFKSPDNSNQGVHAMLKL